MTVFRLPRMQQGSATGSGTSDWRILYRYASESLSWPSGQQAKHGITTRQSEFWFEMMIGLEMDGPLGLLRHVETTEDRFPRRVA